MAVLRKRNITIVPANIKRVFHALNDICSVGGSLVSAVADNCHYQYLAVFKIMRRNKFSDLERIMNNIHRVGILLVELVKSSLHLVLIEEGSDRILSAHIVGPYTEEQINTSALAIQRGITSQNLKEIIFAYLTGSSDISSML